MPACRAPLTVTALTFATATGRPAGAKELADHRHDVRFNWGLFSAVGFIGGTYSFSPIPQLELEAGTGLGLTGIQVSVMPKLSLGCASHRFILGVGPSVGIDPYDGPVHASYWLNAEIGYAYRSEGGFSFLVAAGVTAALGGRMHALCIWSDCSEERKIEGEELAGWGVPQIRFALGAWD